MNDQDESELRLKKNNNFVGKKTCHYKIYRNKMTGEYSFFLIPPHGAWTLYDGKGYESDDAFRVVQNLNKKKELADVREAVSRNKRSGRNNG